MTDAGVRDGENPPDIIPKEELRDLGSEESFTIKLLRGLNLKVGEISRERTTSVTING